MDEQDFIAAVIAAPDDDAPRHAYAAWLTARGDWRGEFITLQLHPHEDWQAQKAARGMLSKDRIEGLLPVAGIAAPSWWRGFLNSVVMDAARFLAVAPTLFTQTPLQELGLFSPLTAGAAAEIAALPLAGRLRRLRLGARTSPEAFAALLASPFLAAGLEDLYVADSPIGDAGAVALAASRWSRLRRLEFYQCDIGAAGVGALSGSPVSERLTDLRLTGNPVGSGVEAIARSPRISRLKTLALSRAKISSAGAAAIANAASCTGLEALELAENLIGDAGAVALATGKSLPKLRRLDLRRNVISAAGAEALGHGSGLPMLETLGLTENSIFSDTIETWTDWDGTVVGEGAAQADAGWLWPRFGLRRFKIE